MAMFAPQSFLQILVLYQDLALLTFSIEKHQRRS